MANTILTPTAVTREALRVLHQKLNFIGRINRQYDDSYAKTGAKIGDTLKIRLPNEYVVRSGATLDVQDTVEASVSLQVATQKGVDLNFSSVELTMDLDDFSERIIAPAMSVLAANIESDAMSMYKDIPNAVFDLDTTATVALILAGSRKLTEQLAMPGKRCLNLNPTDNANLVDALKGLFNDPAKLSKNFREGKVTDQFLGFEDVFENTMWPIHTTGIDDGTGDYKLDGANQSGAAITVDTGSTGTFLKGDIVTFAGSNAVHQETKVDLGYLKQFAVTADTATSATSLAITPTMVLTGAKQNVSAAPTDGGAVWKREHDDSTAIGNVADHTVSMGFQKDAFAFATADLIMPKGVDFAAREVQDGISLRIVRAYDINNDKFPCRLDVLYGFKTIREQLAVRYCFN